MTSKSSYVLVGIFVLVLGAAFIWGILWISAGGTPQSFERYLVYMSDSVSGLNVDAAVKYRGVDVGKVEQIGIDGKNPERIRLLLQVRQGTPIDEDTIASLEYQGLTGIASVNLSGGKAGSPPLRQMPGERYPVIKGRPSFFSSLDTTLSDLLTNLTQTSAGINAMLGEENRVNISRSIENVAIFTDRLADQSGKLDEIIANLSVTLENTHAASADLPPMIQQFSHSAQAITRMAEQIRSMGENLAAASAGIEHTVNASSDDLVDFTHTTLPEITATVYELRLAAENLRRMSDALAQNPSLLIYGAPAPKPGPGE